MLTSTKKRVTNIVLAYKALFKDEYEAACRINKQRANNALTKWGETQNKEFARETLRYPTNLDTALRFKLSPDQYDDLFTDKGIIWFQRTFPEFVPNRSIE